MSALITTLHARSGMQDEHIENILALLEQGCTIPFIARYRKELTGGASDEDLRDFEIIYSYEQRLQTRKVEVARLIETRSVLTADLKEALESATTLAQVEDIYLPFKQQKNTRAKTAIALGLEPLADRLRSGKSTLEELNQFAKTFITQEVTTVQEALQGAKDIIAERFNTPKERDIIRQQMQGYGTLECRATKQFVKEGVFSMYEKRDEKVRFIPSYRFLAMMRGVKEKQLKVSVVFDLDRYIENMRRIKIKSHFNSSKSVLLEAYLDGLKRLVIPSIEREVLTTLKEKADLESSHLFGKNLAQLLMTPPIQKQVVLGVDPGFRTGCKYAVCDANLNCIDHGVIYPTAPKMDYEGSKKVIESLIKKHAITAVAIGNGTASRETQDFFASLNSEGVTIHYTVVSEAGASIYSASKLAQEEFPSLDVTIRGAISIAQRLQDPISALVKIDPKSLGIGQYQHDVDQRLLEKRLLDTIETIVNKVGVDINSASAKLLSFVAGISDKLAKEIVHHRQEKGSFKSKKDLLEVKGLGAKVFEQAAGFIRIKNAENILDNTGVHPESFSLAKALLERFDITTLKADLTMAQTLSCGQETLEDIIKELRRPGFDPRDELPKVVFRDEVTDISMLHVGSLVSGVVRSIVDFGAFVDIGLKNDALLHVSQLSSKKIAHPLEVLQLNEYLTNVQVISVDLKQNKVGLSLI